MSGTLPPLEPPAAAPPSGWLRPFAAIRQRLGSLRRARQQLAAAEETGVSEALDAMEQAASTLQAGVSALQTGVHALTGSVRRVEGAVSGHASHLTRLDLTVQHQEQRLQQVEARLAAMALGRAAGSTGGSRG